MTMLPDTIRWAVVKYPPDGGQPFIFGESSDKGEVEEFLKDLEQNRPNIRWRLARLRVIEIGHVEVKPTTISPMIRGVEEPCFSQASLTEPDEIDECWAPDCGAKCDWDNCQDGRESPMFKRYDAWTRGEELGEGPDENEGDGE